MSVPNEASKLDKSQMPNHAASQSSWARPGPRIGSVMMESRWVWQCKIRVCLSNQVYSTAVWNLVELKVGKSESRGWYDMISMNDQFCTKKRIRYHSSLFFASFGMVVGSKYHLTKLCLIGYAIDTLQIWSEINLLLAGVRQGQQGQAGL